MNATIHEGGMLKTSVPERALFVLTCLPGHASAPHLAWTAIMAEKGPRVLWLDMHGRRVTPGGLAELHAWITEQVQRGALPHGDSGIKERGRRPSRAR